MICLSIVSHGQAALVERLLACLARCPSDLVRQVIYTRNLPAVDPLPAALTGLPGLQVIDNVQPRGFGSNHNAAFARCDQPTFCVLNPDLEWSTDPFGPLLERLAEDERRPDGSAVKGLGLVAPLVTAPGGRIENTARALYTPLELLRQKVAPRNVTHAPAWLAGMFLLFRASAFRTIGGFDERYFLYIEDVDICTRLRLDGWRLEQVRSSHVVHHAQSTSHRSPRYARWHLSGMLRYWTSPSFWRYRSALALDRTRIDAAPGGRPS